MLLHPEVAITQSQVPGKRLVWSYAVQCYTLIKCRVFSNTNICVKVPQVHDTHFYFRPAGDEVNTC